MLRFGEQGITIVQFRQAQQRGTVGFGQCGTGFTQAGNVLVLQERDDLLFETGRKPGRLGQRTEHADMGDVDPRGRCPGDLQRGRHATDDFQVCFQTGIAENFGAKLDRLTARRQ